MAKEPMPKMAKMPTAQVAEFLLNNKKADLLELGGTITLTEKNTSTEVIRLIYKDKTMSIWYRTFWLVDCWIEEFYVESSFWGRIKNSQFTCGGFKGKGQMCGVTSWGGMPHETSLRSWNSGTNYAVNNRNTVTVKKSNFENFSELVEYSQKTFKAAPKYEVTDTYTDRRNNTTITICVTMPNGIKHYAEGSNKKTAAENFAKNYKA
jgi:hypothetical protein